MTAEKFVPANSPAGVGAEVRTSGGVFAGELVEIREAALIVLSNEAGGSALPGRPPRQLLRLIPFPSIDRARFHQLGSGFDITGARAPSGRVRERLRVLSRFPYGMSRELEAELLKVYGQAGFAGVER